MSQVEYNIRGDIQHSGIPPELRHIDQWLAYRAIRKPNGKINKPPINAKTGGPGSSTDPTTWSTFEAASGRSPLGAAFVLTADDPYVAIDLDQCRDADTSEIAPWAMTIVNRLPIYWEVSYSGTGLRGIGRGVLVGDGRKKGDIEVYDNARLVVMTGRTLPGHGVIRNCQRELTTWHSEVWPIEPERLKPPSPTFTTTGITKERILETAFRARNGDNIRRLYDGDISGYTESQSDPGFSSEADLALLGFLSGYTNDDALLADLLRTSRLYRKKLDRGDYVDRSIRRVRSKQGWWYDWDRQHTASEPPELHAPPPAGSSCDVLLAATRADLVRANLTITRQAEQINTLQERVRLADEREAIQRNTKLGASRQTGAALATLFREERPREPDKPAGYRMPLARLAERTGLSADACSRQLKQLAKYRTPDGTPVLHIKTRDIPRSVNQETGEIIEPHKEVWVGPGPIQHDAFGHVLATLTPADAPKHGGAPDRGVCPEHPNAGVLRRTSNMRRITHSCAHCQKILDTQVIPVGRESTEHLRSMAAPPDPIQHDAFADEPATDDPMPQHAASIDNHVVYDLSGKMRHSSTSGPPPGWESERRRVYGQLYNGEVAS